MSDPVVPAGSATPSALSVDSIVRAARIILASENPRIDDVLSILADLCDTISPRIPRQRPAVGAGPCANCGHRAHQPGSCRATYFVDGETRDPCLCTVGAGPERLTSQPDTPTETPPILPTATVRCTCEYFWPDPAQWGAGPSRIGGLCIVHPSGANYAHPPEVPGEPVPALPDTVDVRPRSVDQVITENFNLTREVARLRAALAARPALPDDTAPTFEDALRWAADEVHREARWQMETTERSQRGRSTEWGIERLAMLERIFRNAAAVPLGPEPTTEGDKT